MENIIEAGTMMVDIDTGTVFQTKTHQGFRLVRVQTKSRIESPQNTGAGGEGGGGHGEGRRYVIMICYFESTCREDREANRFNFVSIYTV
jgi:hypothetical protein